MSDKHSVECPVCSSILDVKIEENGAIVGVSEEGEEMREKISKLLADLEQLVNKRCLEGKEDKDYKGAYFEFKNSLVHIINSDKPIDSAFEEVKEILGVEEDSE